MAALQVHLNVSVPQQVEDGAGNIEPASGVEGGQAVPVEEVYLEVLVFQQPLPYVRVIVPHGPSQPPAALGVDIDVVVQNELNRV